MEYTIKFHRDLLNKIANVAPDMPFSQATEARVLSGQLPDASGDGFGRMAFDQLLSQLSPVADLNAPGVRVLDASSQAPVDDLRPEALRPVCNDIFRLRPEPCGFDNPLLVRAVSVRSSHVAQALVDRGADPMVPNKSGAFPLALAAKAGFFGVFSVLLNATRPGEESCRDGTGHAVLHYLVSDPTPERLACLRLFLRRKPDLETIVKVTIAPDGTKSDGENALHIAVAGGNLQALELLADAGANINATLLDGTTVLGLAEQVEWDDGIAFLRSRGAISIIGGPGSESISVESQQSAVSMDPDDESNQNELPSSVSQRSAGTGVQDQDDPGKRRVHDDLASAGLAGLGRLSRSGKPRS